MEAIRTASEVATSGVVIGGGLLGLEAANALARECDLEVATRRRTACCDPW